jgi:hypothetical protein
MDVLSHSTYLVDFADPQALKLWSPEVREALVNRLMNEPASEAAWRAFLELLFHWPAKESIEPTVARAVPSLRRWDWRVRELRHDDPVLSRSGGIAMALVGCLALRRVEDLHGLTLAAICAHPHVEGLRGLRLHQVETFPECIGAIARCDALSGLESLDVSKVRLAGGIDGAFGGSRLARLKELRLNSADLARADLEALAARPPSDVIERLDLSANPIDAGGLGVLLAADGFPNLKVLDVSDAWLPADAFEAAISRRRLPALEAILLSGTDAAKRFGDELLL